MVMTMDEQRVIDEISVLFKNLGEGFSTQIMMGLDEHIGIPRANYMVISQQPELAIRYLEPLLDVDELIPIVLGVIWRVAEHNHSKVLFSTLLDMCRKHGGYSRFILYIIARVFKGEGNTIITHEDAMALLETASSRRDLMDRIITLGHIFENTSDLQVAEILLNILEKNHGLMRHIVDALVRIFASSSPLLDRYGRIFHRLSPVRAEALLRAIGLLQIYNYDAYHKNPNLRYIIMYSLLRGSERLRAQAIVTLGYIFRSSGIKYVASLLRRFLGVSKIVDIAIARAMGLVYRRTGSPIARRMLVDLLSRRDPDVVKETLLAFGEVFEGTKSREILKIFEAYYRDDLDRYYFHAIRKIYGSEPQKIAVNILTIKGKTLPEFMERIIGDTGDTNRKQDGTLRIDKLMINYSPQYGVTIAKYSLWIVPIRVRPVRLDNYVVNAGAIILVLDNNMQNPLLIGLLANILWRTVGHVPIIIVNTMGKPRKDVIDRILDYMGRLSRNAGTRVEYVDADDYRDIDDFLEYITDLSINNLEANRTGGNRINVSH